MTKTTIEWTDATWNPVTGCAKVSQGCKHCYAERTWGRLSAPGMPYAGREFTDVQCHPERLNAPLLRSKRPQRIFVNSMSDLFHEDVPEQFIGAVFAMMALAPQHTFQVLTKRPERMREMLTRWQQSGLTLREGCGVVLPNVWLGVSVEDQATADERIPLLLQTPAAVRWISAEPLLGTIDLTGLPSWRGLAEGQSYVNALGRFAWECTGSDYVDTCNIGTGIDWVVVGGESGPHARPMHPDWARSLRDQCEAAGVPLMFKQWGEWSPDRRSHTPMQAFLPNGEIYNPTRPDDLLRPEMATMYRVGKKAAGRLLDGRLWDEYPA